MVSRVYGVLSTGTTCMFKEIQLMILTTILLHKQSNAACDHPPKR